MTMRRYQSGLWLLALVVATAFLTVISIDDLLRSIILLPGVKMISEPMINTSILLSEVITSHSTISPGQTRPMTRSWKPWTISDEILFTNISTCRWNNYTSRYRDFSYQRMKVCLHPQGDLISDKISGKGYWDDCLSVPRQYFANNESRSHGLHIEIGANIGSCIFELLLSDSVVEILAFEPHPRNLFALTSSLKNNPDLGRRVTVFPVALGTVDDQKVTMGIEIPRTSNPIAVNMGTNFVLQDEHSSKTHPKVPRVEVPMERLDTILNEYFHFQIPSIRFMKVDAQGFECNILNGSFPTILPDRLIFEVEGSMLERAGCSKKGLLNRVGQYYELYRYRASGALDKTGLDNDENINAVGVLRQAFPSAQE